MFSNKEELDRLISNMDEKAIQNLLSILDLYIYERSLEEIKDRINSEDFNEKFERKMRWIMEFKKSMEERLKEQY